MRSLYQRITTHTGFHWLGAVLLLCGVMVLDGSLAMPLTIMGMMLFWPLLDRRWPFSVNTLLSGVQSGLCLPIAAMIILLLLWYPDRTDYALRTLIIAALPEEWFFRAYFMSREGKGWRANIVTTLWFGTLHAVNQGLAVGILVCGPSLFFGWCYQRSRDLVFLVLLHTLSNIVYSIWVGDWIERLLAG